MPRREKVIIEQEISLLTDKKIILSIYCIITIFFFSTIEVVGKLVGSGISPYAITAWRFLIGGLLIFPLALKEISQRKYKLKALNYFEFFLAGILIVCISMLLLQLSIFYGKAVLSAAIVSTNTIFVTVLAVVFLKEKITFLHVVGLIIGLIGLFLIIYGEKEVLRQSHNLVLGVVFGLGAAITFAVYTVFSKRLIQLYGNMTTLCFAFIFGACALFVYSLLMNKSITFVPDFKNLSLLMYLSFFVTGLAYILYFTAVKELGAAKASLYFFLKPAIAAILAWLIHSEQLKLIQIMGIILIMLSLSRQTILNLLESKLIRIDNQ